MSIQSVGASNSQYAPAVQTASAAAARKADATPEAARLQTPQDAAQADKAAQQPSSEELNQAVKQIQDVITKTANRLEFSIDEDLGVSIVKVVDTESKKLIRQIPSEEVLKIAKALDTLQGLLVKQQA